MTVTCFKCGQSLPMVEAHIDDRGWSCDPCYFSNQPWEDKTEEADSNGDLCGRW